MKLKLEYIKNFLIFLRFLFIKIWKRENYLLPKDRWKQRLEICKNCERISKNKKQCLECGCVVYWKTKFSFETCMLNKWEI